MNDQSNNKKGSPLKFLAIAGFIVAIIIISWLSIKLVNVMPDAFSSLASIAESLDDRSLTGDDDGKNSTLTVTSDSTWVNSGETVKVSWNPAKAQGSYTFSYTCTDGVNIDIQDEENGLRNIDCDTNYNVGNTDSLSVNVESEKERFKNIKYTVAFLETGDESPRTSGTASFTVINSDIQDMLANNNDVESEPETVTTTEEIVDETVTVTEPEVTQNNTPPAPSTPIYQQEFVYTIPTSDPNGRIDLATRFLSNGNIVVDTFFPGIILQNASGAVQFEVKNYGTKTSTDWTYTVSLPGGGEYESTEQKPLKPNERAVITVGFPTSNTSQHTFVVRVKESNDKSILNNQFSQSVVFIK